MQCVAHQGVLHASVQFSFQAQNFIYPFEAEWLGLHVQIQQKKQLIFGNEYIGNLGERPASDEGVSFVSLF